MSLRGTYAYSVDMAQKLGFDGTMPTSVYSDMLAETWNAYQSGRKDKARDLFARVATMLNTEQQVPGTRRYLMKKRGVFKTMVSRQDKSVLTPEGMREIDFQWEGIKPFLRT